MTAVMSLVHNILKILQNSCLAFVRLARKDIRVVRGSYWQHQHSTRGAWHTICSGKTGTAGRTLEKHKERVDII